jgi:hypothetical protein
MRPELFIAAMLALVLFWNHGSRLRFGYRCVQCGTQRPDEHSPGCSYADS